MLCRGGLQGGDGAVRVTSGRQHLCKVFTAKLGEVDQFLTDIAHFAAFPVSNKHVADLTSCGAISPGDGDVGYKGRCGVGRSAGPQFVEVKISELDRVFRPQFSSDRCYAQTLLEKAGVNKYVGKIGAHDV